MAVTVTTNKESLKQIFDKVNRVYYFETAGAALADQTKCHNRILFKFLLSICYCHPVTLANQYWQIHVQLEMGERHAQDSFIVAQDQS